MYKKIFMITAGVVFFCPMQLWSSAGTLDATFNVIGTPPGTVTTAIPGGHARGNAVALQSDGKIVVAGRVSGISAMVVARYTTDGILDVTFGAGLGYITLALGIDSGADAVVVQPDGKIVVAGYDITDITQELVVARFEADGTPDLSFGAGLGYVSKVVDDYSLAYSVALQSDGKIVVAGISGNAGISSMLVVRYLADGTIDSSFNGVGYASLNIDVQSQAYAVKVQSDGKIVLAGYAYTTIAGVDQIAVVRYLANGTLDPSFNGTGYATVSVGVASYGYAIAVQPDGKIVVTGYGSDGTYQFATVRYTASGALDASFNTTGIVITDIGFSSESFAVVVQPNGKIVVGGYNKESLFGPLQFALVRYLANGTLDPSFNSTGIVTTAIGSTADGSSLVLQPDGKIVMAGSAQDGERGVLAVARYYGDIPIPDNPTSIACALRLINKYGQRLRDNG